MPQGRFIKIEWQPQERQLVCLNACGLSQPFGQNLKLRPSGSIGQPKHQAVADIIGYGGAAGGGKTDTGLAAAIIACLTYPGINVGYFRREFPQLEGPGGAIMRSRELIGHFAIYNGQNKRWLVPTGIFKKDASGEFVLDEKGKKIPVFSVIQFCHCQNLQDVYNYQSQQFDIMVFDEATQFEKEQIKYLLTRNRATVNYPTFKPFALLSTNPGNIGHQYFKDEFVTLGEPEKVNVYVNETGVEEKHIFIPSKLSDNQILEQRDPTYRNRISSTELNRKMLLEGDWDVFAGQAFSELSREVHLIDPIQIQPHWTRFASFDYGYNHPYSFQVFCVDDDGVVYLVNHTTSRLKKPYQIAQDMIKACNTVGGVKTLSYIVAGHDCWNKNQGGPSIAEIFANLEKYYPTLGLPNIYLRRASIARVAGATQVREYIAYKDKVKDEQGNMVNGTPRVYIFKSCSKVYDNLARMIFDQDGDAEDVLKVDADENGFGGDDDYDCFRYGLMSRPQIGKKEQRKASANSIMGYLKKKQEERWLKQSYVGY